MQDLRLAALRRFAIAMTVLNIVGHTVLGFEPPIAQPLAALAAAYGMEILLEVLDARARGRRPRFRGGPMALVNFLLSAHITGLACAMLLYANERILPVAFAAAAAIGSKAIFRVRAGTGTRHFFNPSNFGITLTLLLFPWVGIAPPYQFTENVSGWVDWALPALFIVIGSFLNARFTKKIPVVLAWVSGFSLQAVVRSALHGTPVPAALLPMTGVAFLLFTFYMVTDPATTPGPWRRQILFGAGVAAVYGVLVSLHVVFGLFFALTAVCTVRGVALQIAASRADARAARLAPAGRPELGPAPAVLSGDGARPALGAPARLMRQVRE
jgi:hypothetical protein